MGSQVATAEEACDEAQQAGEEELREGEEDQQGWGTK